MLMPTTLTPAPATQAPPLTVHRLAVFLADDEWGSPLMDRLAKEYAQQHADLRPLIVTVHEHAGWFLSYLFAPGFTPGLIVGTANDRAQFSPEAEQFGEEQEHARREHLPSIRRPRKEARP